MSERTFRAVVASVLVGALALAVVVAATRILPTSPEPPPSASVVISAAPSATATSAPTRVPGPAFVAPGVVSVGQIARGASSADTLVLRFLESSADAIPNQAGSFRVVLSDQAGDSSTVAFVGAPSVVAPGSLGATATLIAPNVLLVNILASDPLNVELITIGGLGIGASPRAAIGPVKADLSGCIGSLLDCAATSSLASPASVSAS